MWTAIAPHPARALIAGMDCEGVLFSCRMNCGHKASYLVYRAAAGRGAKLGCLYNYY